MASPTNNLNSKSVFDVAGRSGRFNQGPFMHPPSPDAPATGSSADIEQPLKAAADSSSNPQAAAMRQEDIDPVFDLRRTRDPETYFVPNRS